MLPVDSRDSDAEEFRVEAALGAIASVSEPHHGAQPAIWVCVAY